MFFCYVRSNIGYNVNYIVKKNGHMVFKKPVLINTVELLSHAEKDLCDIYRGLGYIH